MNLTDEKLLQMRGCVGLDIPADELQAVIDAAIEARRQVKTLRNACRAAGDVLTGSLAKNPLGDQLKSDMQAVVGIFGAALSGKRLWEVDHPYYCTIGNYFKPPSECHAHFTSWAEFVGYKNPVTKSADFDPDFNFVFRWDWKLSETPSSDDSVKDGVLRLFVVQQRRALLSSYSIDVCRNDEPVIRAWLQERWDYMVKMWEPFTETKDASDVAQEKQPDAAAE